MHTPITVAVTRRVRPGFEGKFETALHDFIVRSQEAAGPGGVHIVRPSPNSASHHYGILRTFQSAAARDAFYASDLFSEWEDRVAHMVEGEARYEHISGFEGWLTLPGETTMVPPPRWKTTLLTLLGVYPLTVVWPLVLFPWIGSWPLLIRSFIVATAVVFTLGYGLMPFLTRWLHSWLHAGEVKEQVP